LQMGRKKIQERAEVVRSNMRHGQDV